MRTTNLILIAALAAACGSDDEPTLCEDPTGEHAITVTWLDGTCDVQDPTFTFDFTVRETAAGFAVVSSEGNGVATTNEIATGCVLRVELDNVAGKQWLINLLDTPQQTTTLYGSGVFTLADGERSCTTTFDVTAYTEAVGE